MCFLSFDLLFESMAYEHEGADVSECVCVRMFKNN